MENKTDPETAAKPIKAALSAICVYCGSAVGTDPAHRDAATSFGRLLAENQIRLVYGGGSLGLMGELADAALAAGGKVTGILPRFLHEREVGHPDVDDLVLVDSMHTRKRLMLERSDAFVVLPGGLGTLDETFEIITWRMLSLHDRPIVVANIGGYWDPMLALWEQQAAFGFLRTEHRRIPYVVDGVEAILPALEDAAPAARHTVAKRL
mgnify:CR=1 FL=1